MVNVGQLTAETGSGVYGTPANFDDFRVLASLLHRRRAKQVNQTLHDVWPSPAWYTIYTFSGCLSPNEILPGAKFTLRSSLALSFIGSVTAQHLSSKRQPNFAAWYLHTTGRPSRSTLGGRTA